MLELAQKGEPTSNVKNTNMCKLFSYWNDFIKGIKKDKTSVDESAFKEYIFKNLRVLISELPKNYVDKMELQNQFFEKLNSAGRQLEPHEILKTELDINGDSLRAWNKSMDFSEPFAKGTGSYCGSTHQILAILDQKAEEWKRPFGSPENENESLNSLTRYAPINFSIFLLHVLALYLEYNVLKESVGFWEPKKLLDTFRIYIEKLKNDEGKFIEILNDYRIFMDENIIHILLKDGHSEFRFWDTKDEKNNEPSRDSTLSQFQSMLYVSSGERQEWMLDAYRGCRNVIDGVVSPISLKMLKEQDNRRHTVVASLNYRKIDRYWFWRLDYYLWEKLTEFFNDHKSRDIAKYYGFKSNRSIEHIAPQNPKTSSNVLVSADLRDSFGNLSMISNYQNSKLQNESFEVKRAHVESFINSSTTGSIESLKMLKVYVEYKTGWNDDTIRLHGDAMIRVLIDSFPREEYFTGVRQTLFAQMSEDGQKMLAESEGMLEYSDLQRTNTQ